MLRKTAKLAGLWDTFKACGELLGGNTCSWAETKKKRLWSSGKPSHLLCRPPSPAPADGCLLQRSLQSIHKHISHVVMEAHLLSGSSLGDLSSTFSRRSRAPRICSYFTGQDIIFRLKAHVSSWSQHKSRTQLLALQLSGGHVYWSHGFKSDAAFHKKSGISVFLLKIQWKDKIWTHTASLWQWANNF